MSERGDRPSQRTLVIIPTYNERENLPLIVGRVHAARPDVHVLVVDDGSPDGTGEFADELSLADPDRIHVMHRTNKAGLGAAYLAGFAWGLGRGYTVLVEMDADGSHAPEELYRLLDAVDAGADLAIGSRYIARRHRAQLAAAPDGAVADRERLLAGRARRRRQRHHRRVTGPTAARCWRRSTLDAVDSKGYCFQVDLTWRTISGGIRPSSKCPSRSPSASSGKSKMSGSNIREAIFKIAEWGIRGRLDRARGVVR